MGVMKKADFIGLLSLVMNRPISRCEVSQTPPIAQLMALETGGSRPFESSPTNDVGAARGADGICFCPKCDDGALVV